MLLVRDDAYGMIRWKQAEMGMPNYGMTLGNPDFVRSRGYGAHGHRPAAPPSSGRRCATAWSRPGVHLIDLAIDYSDNARVLGDELAR